MSYEAIDDNGHIVVLRKRRRCEWCNVWIESGQEAVKRVYKYDDQFHNARMHAECYTAMVNTIHRSWDGEFEPGGQGRGLGLGEME